MRQQFTYPLASSFEEFARQDIIDSSITSYNSYLKSLDTNLFTQFTDKKSPFTIVTREALKNNPDEVLTSLSEWEDIIDGEIDEPNILKGYSKKTIQNWRSGFLKYVQFIEYLIDNDNSSEQDFGSYSPNANKPRKAQATKGTRQRAKKVISFKTLDEKIQRCLRGQDRFSPARETNLPINFISQILNLDPKHKRGHDFINDWIKGNKANVKALVLTQSGKDIEIPASSIVKMLIYGKEKPVEVVYDKNKVGILRTRKGDGEGLENMYLENSRQLHIDHEPSVASILEDLGDTQKQLPALARLTRIIKDVAHANNIDKVNTHDPILAKGIKSDKAIVAEINGLLADIQKELKLFDSQVERLEFMFGSDNISKGK